PRATAQIGHGVSVPSFAVGSASHSWWATVVLIAVDATIFASLAFSHVHVSMKLDVCPPPGAQLPGDGLWPTLMLAGASLLMAWAARRVQRPGQALLRVAVALATAGSIVAFALELWLHLQAGLAPTHTAWGATVAAMLFWQGFHAVVLLLMGGYVVARSVAGLLRPDARATLDNSALFWHYVTVQGIAAIWLVRLLPQWMGG
ncbi:MAG TPA: cytochrome ubiquinol oxidase subunit I, partial [Ramlibacter sp.]|nr:cytochrome ubiquinol oxidase subunit I [Ramlibacter sp.]